MKNELSTKQKILTAFEKSESKNISEICRNLGITNNTYYFHFYRDLEFRRKVLEYRRTVINEQLEQIAA